MFSMQEAERLSALIGDIYDAALHPTLWSMFWLKRERSSAALRLRFPGRMRLPNAGAPTLTKAVRTHTTDNSTSKVCSECSLGTTFGSNWPVTSRKERYKHRRQTLTFDASLSFGPTGANKRFACCLVAANFSLNNH